MNRCLSRLPGALAFFVCLVLLGAQPLAVSAPPGDVAPAPKAGVDLKVSNYKDLCAAIRAQQGSVVVVDIWGEF